MTTPQAAETPRMEDAAATPWISFGGYRVKRLPNGIWCERDIGGCVAANEICSAMLDEIVRLRSAASTPSTPPSGGAAIAEVERLFRVALARTYQCAEHSADDDESYEVVHARSVAADEACIAALRRLASPQDNDGVRDAISDEDLTERVMSLVDQHREFPFRSREWLADAIRALKTNTKTDKPGREGKGPRGWPAEALAQEI